MTGVSAAAINRALELFESIDRIVIEKKKSEKSGEKQYLCDDSCRKIEIGLQHGNVDRLDRMLVSLSERMTRKRRRFRIVK